MIDSRKVLLHFYLVPTALLILISPGSDAGENGTSMIPGSCTIFAVSQGQSAFFGNNEDWKNPLTYVWVEPPDEGKYGVLCFGFDNLYPQGAINEKGLAFDANALPTVAVKKNPDGLKPYQAIVNNIIMQQCATVEEAIEMAKSYDWSQQYGGRIDGQFMLADATGDGVLISADSTGEIVFTRKPKGDGFLVSTNFNRAHPENRYGSYPCKRYDAAVRMLGEIRSESDLTVDNLASILDAVHEEGRKLNTLYSNIFDLKNGVAYIYYWHRFDDPVVLDVADIIARRPEPARISSLFPADVVEQAESKYRSYKRRPFFILAAWIILMAGSFAFIAYRRSRKTTI